MNAAAGTSKVRKKAIDRIYMIYKIREERVVFHA
jgi:hypothetical protein